MGFSSKIHIPQAGFCYQVPLVSRARLLNIENAAGALL